MKVNKSHSLIWFILLSVNFALGSPAISDITITPNQGAGTITISYSIEGITNTAEVTAQASIDGGSSYSVSLSNATGAVGTGITNGSGKTIVWQADQDLPNGGPFEMRIKLDAFEQSTGSSGSTNEEYPTQDFTVSSAYKLPKTGCTWDSPHLPYDDGELQIGREFSFMDNGDGTVTDNNTGLMWIQDFNIGRNNGDFFEDANAAKVFVDNLEYAGYDDWRLPTKRELCFIMKVTDEPMLVFDPRYFKNVNYHPIFYKESYDYWSSNTESKVDSKFPVSDFYQWDRMSSFGDYNIRLLSDDDSFNILRSSFPPYTDTFNLSNIRYDFQKYFNIKIVRGTDRTFPNISSIGDSLFSDSNNQLVYKVINFNNQIYQDYIKEQLTIHDSYTNPSKNFDFILHSIKEQITSEDFRLANINECLNFTTSIDLNSSLTSTLSAQSDIYHDPCRGKHVSNTDICKRGFYTLIFHDNRNWGGVSSGIFIDNSYEDFTESVILVKSL